MKYLVNIPGNVEDDILRHRMSGDKSVLVKIDKLLTELEEHPQNGTGKPGYKKHDGFWARRITDKHRMTYEINEEKMTVKLLSAWGHYDDK